MFLYFSIIKDHIRIARPDDHYSRPPRTSSSSSMRWDAIGLRKNPRLGMAPVPTSSLGLVTTSTVARAKRTKQNKNTKTAYVKCLYRKTRTSRKMITYLDALVLLSVFRPSGARLPPVKSGDQTREGSPMGLRSYDAGVVSVQESIDVLQQKQRLRTCIGERVRDAWWVEVGR